MDFRQNLKSLWEYKIRKYGGRNTPLKNFYESKILPLIESPKPWTRTTLEKYVGEIDADIDGIVAKMGGIKGYEKTLKEKK